MLLMVIADDITGAFDTGVQFSNQNARVRVALGAAIGANAFARETDVLIVDAETRHLPEAGAEAETRRIVRLALQNGVERFYIKTDSGLRGNIAAAFAAVMRETGAMFAAYAPAHPAMNRVTVEGTYLVDGIPLDQTVFGDDPFNPVKSPYVRDLFRGSWLTTREFGRGDEWDLAVKEPTVGIFDIATEEDFRRVTKRLAAVDLELMRVTGGCAAFAKVLTEAMHKGGGQRRDILLEKPLLVVCGSVSPITKRQFDEGERAGYRRVSLTEEQLLGAAGNASPEWRRWLAKLIAGLDGADTVMIDTGFISPREAARCCGERGLTLEQMRQTIAGRIGGLIQDLLEAGLDARYTPMVIGGDTLMGFLDGLEDQEVSLLGESAPGVVLFSARVNGREVRMLSKSGSFGEATLFRDLTGQPLCTGAAG